MEEIKTDVLIVGSGGAGLFAALHVYDNNPSLNVVLATKGLIGKCGCSRMVQGGLNVVLNPDDSVKKHFLDTIKGGGYVNNQDLAWTLVNDAPATVHELDIKVGCFWDRAEDGKIHQKAFAGQSFDRTVHVADLSGIQIIARLTDQIFRREDKIKVLEETRALDLLTTEEGDRVVGAVMANIRTGEIFVVNAKVVVVATGGAASMYKISAPSFDKTGDGMAMCFRAMAEFVDMEMLQFHPTGLLAGQSRLSGSVLEEGLRGAGGYMINGLGERYMERYDPERMERSTRDRVARAGYMEIMAGRGTENGGVMIDMRHLGAEFVEKKFPGMCERVHDIGKDLAREPVEVSPTAHFQMGGVKIDIHCQSNLKGLLVAGEDSGGVHGANRLGGNGICESTVFGRRAGDAAAALAEQEHLRPYRQEQLEEIRQRWLKYYKRTSGVDIYTIRDEIKTLMWEKVGVVRDGKKLEEAISRLDELLEMAGIAYVYNRTLSSYNMEWNDIINVTNWITVARMVASAALLRTESRGSHYRSDYASTDNDKWLVNIHQKNKGQMEIEQYTKPINAPRFSVEDIRKVNPQY
ncbi:FAD-binding protein [Desulfoscipio gibsoniae]|uniref:Succinate dehydrogenase/fumarate reductase flavoprotein subunit n=1 Tax=Desulfoscipio gibsoniae DSM 7213 TaxID=767817 RepID=R4KGP9_9FIRM|nr:FAD-binding protein [Desulfoscipio gibsoniae]AGK99694.1 succinate dehydrogenase/fumarate reductase flavoprotein subunit [Desulfoscipio gibsoniae DSM 7213]